MLIPPLPSLPILQLPVELAEFDPFTAHLDRLRLRRRLPDLCVPAAPPAPSRPERPVPDETAPLLPMPGPEPRPAPAMEPPDPLPRNSVEWQARLSAALHDTAAPARLSVQLAPPELGMVRVVLEQREGRLYARLVTPSRITAALLRSHKQALLDLLGPEADVDVEFGSDFLDSGPDERHPSHQERR